jgi:hypothetical protein
MGPNRTSERDPVAEDAFLVGEAWEERGRVRARAPQLGDAAFRIARGEEEPGAALRFERAEGRQLRDVVGTTVAMLKLVSPRVLEVLEQQGFTGWRAVPVDLEVSGGDGYALLVVTGRAGPVEDELSGRVTIEPPVPEGEPGPGFRGLFFRRGTCDGSDVFTPGDRASIVVVGSVKDALTEAGITGVEFRRLADEERPLLDDDDDLNA